MCRAINNLPSFEIIQTDKNAYARVTVRTLKKPPENNLLFLIQLEPKVFVLRDKGLKNGN